MKPTLGWKLKLAMVAVVAIGLSVIASDSPKQPGPPAEKIKPIDNTDGRLLITKRDGFDVVAPDGKELATVQLSTDMPCFGQLSPDGQRVAYLMPKERDGKPSDEIVLRDTIGSRFITTIDVEATQVCWSPDGKRLYVSTFMDDEIITASHSRIDLVARTVEKLDWPTTVRPLQWTQDGKSVLVCRHAKDKTLLLSLMSVDGKTITDLTGIRGDDWGMVEARLSPDGRRVIYTDPPPGKKENDAWTMNRRLYVYDVGTRKRSEVGEVPLNATVFWCCWSPDGKKIAYAWRQRHAALVEKLAKGEALSAEEIATETEMFLIVANADGSDAKTIASKKTNDIRATPFEGIDWR